MIASSKLQAGAIFPSIELLTIQDELVDLGYINDADRWKLIIIYRGLHSPTCKAYLESLNDHLEELNALGVSVVAASADSDKKARQQAKQSNLRLMLAYGLNAEQMQSLGLYISTPRSDHEGDRPFSEPAMFLLNGDGHIQMLDISNSPFCRPDLDAVVKGVQMTRDHNYPIRGTYELYAPAC